MPRIKATGIPQLDALIAEARHDAYKAVSEAAKMLAEGYRNAVRDFYGSYSPKYYKRTLSTFQATDAFHGVPKVMFIGDNAFRGGIKVDSSYIPGDPYKYHMFNGFMSMGHYDKEMVFTGTYFAGSHGGVAWSTPPAALMQAEFQKACSHVEKVFFNKYA